MKTVLLILFALFTLGLRAQENPPTRQPDPVIPTIAMDGVPLIDAVKNLARQAHVNFIFDPHTASFCKDAVVSKRWEKVTTQQALNDILAINKLKFVTNSATTVVRIVFAADQSTPSTPIAAANGANTVIPLIVMDEVPLADAIQNLARQAGVMAELDPQLNSPGSGMDGQPMTRMLISLRWEKLTALQALNAILENYGLVLVDGPVASTKIITKPKPGAGK